MPAKTKEGQAMTLKNITVNGQLLQYCSACGRRKFSRVCPCMLPPRNKHVISHANGKLNVRIIE
jgi:NADH pyrophosphatase NudC (nudix superfamily)